MQPQYETSRLLLSVSHPDKAAGVLEFTNETETFWSRMSRSKDPGFILRIFNGRILHLNIIPL